THEFDANGEDAEYSMERVLAIYKAAGVDGVLSIEFEGSGDQKLGVKKTRDLLQRYM
ncbi:MAG TPA: xylose isomerase, partial [Armatimonadetes bacterium]|nr:xylose isomerase [Armatimonadota bacterium]